MQAFCIVCNKELNSFQTHYCSRSCYHQKRREKIREKIRYRNEEKLLKEALNTLEKKVVAQGKQFEDYSFSTMVFDILKICLVALLISILSITILACSPFLFIVILIGVLVLSMYKYYYFN